MDDEKVIERCRAGDTEAFGHLVRQYQSEAIGHALAILHRREDAHDAVQEAFIRAFRGMARFERGRPFYPWFYTILRNRCYSMLQDRRGIRTVQIDPCRLLAAPSSPAAREQTEILESALAQLSQEDRELITLKHLDGLGYAELGQRLGIPPGTVMSRLYHARQRLRVKIRQQQREASDGG